MHNRLRYLLRVVFVVWLLAACGLAYVVLRDTTAHTGQSPLVFLLQGRDVSVPPVPLTAEPRPAPAPEKPKEEVVAKAEPVAPPPPALREMPRGKKPGKGILKKPEVREVREGIDIVLQYSGETGEYLTALSNPAGRYVDLHGDWKFALTQTHLSSNLVRLVQAAAHKGFVRVTSVAAKPNLALREQVLYSDTEIIIRIRLEKPAPRP